jgi:pyruvate dehydrogenase E2 component (dihydrolipoamide acetyltransferase)
MAEIIMPKMGDAMEDGVIVQWMKNIGDKVAAEEAVFEIETDKSNVEVESREAGYLIEIRHPAGAKVNVGTVVGVVGPNPPAAGAAAAPITTAAPAKPAESVAAAIIPAPSIATTPSAAPAPVAIIAKSGEFKPYGASFVGAMPEGLGGSASVLSDPIVFASELSDGRVKASPLARAIAEKNGVNLSQLGVSGPISAADVTAAISSNGAPKAAATQTTEVPASEVFEYNAMRRTIAKRLAESKSTIPHFYVTVEIDMENLIGLRKQINESAGDSAPKVTINDCLVKAAALAIAENPVINSKFVDNKRITSFGIHIGVAVSLPDGLIVPVVKNCQTLSLRGIASATKPLVDKARANKLALNDYTGGTFTISNLGSMADVENFGAIINPGEGAILAVAGTKLVPAVINNAIVPRQRMKVTLSGDHRVIDGAEGAKFLLSLKRLIENPLEILL